MSLSQKVIVNTIDRVYGDGAKFSSNMIATIFKKTPQDITPTLTKLRRENYISVVETGRPYYYKLAKFVKNPIHIDDTPKPRKKHERKSPEKTPEIIPEIPKKEKIVGKLKFSISVTANEHNLDKLADLIKLAENAGLIIGEMVQKKNKKKKVHCE